MPAELPRRSRAMCSALENWLLDHPLQHNSELVPMFEVFYTDGRIYMYPPDRRDLTLDAEWDWKTQRAAHVIVDLAAGVRKLMDQRPDPESDDITDNTATDGPSPWDEFDWSI